MSKGVRLGFQPADGDKETAGAPAGAPAFLFSALSFLRDLN
jgi:hypothetical protein